MQHFNTQQMHTELLSKAQLQWNTVKSYSSTPSVGNMIYDLILQYTVHVQSMHTVHKVHTHSLHTVHTHYTHTVHTQYTHT